MGEFTHFNQHGDAIMVDISKKAETAREAIAELPPSSGIRVTASPSSPKDASP